MGTTRVSERLPVRRITVAPTKYTVQSRLESENLSFGKEYRSLTQLTLLEGLEFGSWYLRIGTTRIKPTVRSNK